LKEQKRLGPDHWHVTLPAKAPTGMLNPYLLNRSLAGMTGCTVIPQLQAVWNRRRRTTQKRQTQPGWINGQPVGSHEQHFRVPGDMTLIAEFILRVRGYRHKGSHFGTIAPLTVAGDTFGCIFLE